MQHSSHSARPSRSGPSSGKPSLASLYIDFDAFFANVEKQIEPSIRMKPLGITALNGEYSALITV